jgi:predicted nucleic acid-binding protein
VIVVSDSSPLITLARARQLELLDQFFGAIIIPPEVHNEVVVAGAGLPGGEEVGRSPWIRARTHSLDPQEELKIACSGLGAGEQSAIYAASMLDADLVLIDEQRGRRIAKNFGLNVTGSIAILEHGAKVGKVANLRLVYQSLLDQGIRFDTKLLDASLAKLGLEKL